MSQTHRKMDSGEDQETIFHSYPCAYYVQSPSTISHANSSELNKTHIINLDSTTFESPTRSDMNILLNNKIPEVSRFTLSRYSSSHGSNNSFLNENKKVLAGDENGVNRLIIVDGFEEEDEDDDDDDDYDGKNGGWWWRFCSFRKSSSCAWITLQISWRFLVSLLIGLLVFYLATKPPPPKISIKVAGIRQFGLGEGIDGSGVTTKFLTCNCSLNLFVENDSKVFGLHLQPPTLEMFFGRLPLAILQGPKLYAESHGRTLLKLSVGTKNKPMYGAGRTMEDMLESGKGLPILIRIKLNSHFRVVLNLIKSKYHHQAECLLILDDTYDEKHRTQAFNSTCKISSS